MTSDISFPEVSNLSPPDWEDEMIYHPNQWSECKACGHLYRDHDGWECQCTYVDEEGECFCSSFES